MQGRPMAAQRRFNSANLLFLSINGMIGSAWLFAPLYSARLAGSNVIWAWLLGGAATILIALTFAELSTLLPIAGGSARLAELSHGKLTAFIMSWITWLSSVTMAPIETQAVLQYSATYFPGLMHQVNGTPILTHLGLVWAVIILLSLCILNVASLRTFISVNRILFLFKMGVIVATVACLMHTRFVPANFTVPSDSASTWRGIFAAIATGGIAFAFTGFKHAVELAGEAQAPQRSIPIAIIGSVCVCLLLYIALQIAFIGAILPSELAAGWSKLQFSGDLGPFVGLAVALGITYLVIALYIDAAVSPLGAGFIYVTSTARLVFAMSKNGYLPRFLTTLNRTNMPVNAIAFNFIIGLSLFIPLPGWQNMVSFLVSAMVISYAMGPIALIALRKNLPFHKRNFRLPCAYSLCIIAFYCCNLITYWTGWQTLSKLAIGVAIGLIVLLIHVYRTRQTKAIGARGLWWLLPYLLGLLFLSYCGSFGGIGIISFGKDFLLMAVFSLFIFWLAIATRQKDSQQSFDHYQRIFDDEMTAKIP